MARLIPAIIQGFLISVFAFAFLIVPQIAPAAERSTAESRKSEMMANWPKSPSESWSITIGGRLYDNWATVQGIDLPKDTHPTYPKGLKRKGGSTWRCKECHGWDYRGDKGAYATGSHFSGIKGVVRLSGHPPAKIARAIKRGFHKYDASMLPDYLINKIALFISKGQVHMPDFIDFKTKKAKGNSKEGRGPYQNFCANCHGFDGRTINFKSEKKPEFIGTVARKSPWELLHKVINGHPASQMPALRDFPDVYLKNILSYTQTLPKK